jgi:hypothetical protein
MVKGNNIRKTPEEENLCKKLANKIISEGLDHNNKRPSYTND